MNRRKFLKSIAAAPIAATATKVISPAIMARGAEVDLVNNSVIKAPKAEFIASGTHAFDAARYFRHDLIETTTLGDEFRQLVPSPIRKL